MRRIFVFAQIALMVLLLAACAAQLTPTPQPTATTNPILAHLAASATSIPTPTLPPNTPTPYQPIQATITTDNLLLRQGPGLRFDPIGMYPQDQKVTVISQAPSGFWLQVLTADNQSGYMMTNYLTLDGYLFDVPVVQPSGVLIIKGHIYTPNGNPATKLGVTLLEANSDDVSQQDVGWTDDFGEWYVFLPPGLEGNWTLRVDSYNCESNTVNTACNLIGHFPEPQTVAVPLAPDAWIDFQMLP